MTPIAPQCWEARLQELEDAPASSTCAPKEADTKVSAGGRKRRRGDR